MKLDLCPELLNRNTIKGLMIKQLRQATLECQGLLIEMAHDLSDKVHEKQKPIVLNYKSSYDRKIIHMALDKNDKVYTKSIGSGANRKLMILPVKQDQANQHASY